MARNIARSFANMRFAYWPPKLGSMGGKEWEQPVEVRGKWFTDDRAPWAPGARRGDEAVTGGPVGFSALFYLTRPEVGGAVSPGRTLADIRDQGLEGVSPGRMDGVRIIRSVSAYTMIRAKAAAVKDQAFIVTF